MSANLAILIHSRIFELNLSNTNSAINLATSFSIPSSLFKTLTSNFYKFLFSVWFEMNDSKSC